MDNNKESSPIGQPPADQNPSTFDPQKLGEDIMNILYERTPNPSEAFVLLQRMCIVLWEQYQIDWKEQSDSTTADSRKQRYMDFISALIDNLLANTKAG